MINYKLLLTTVFFSIFSLSCSSNEDSSNTEDGIEGLTVKNFPVIDGSDSTTPLRTILMCELLGFNYTWERRPFTQEPGEDIKVVHPVYTCSEEDSRHLVSDCLKESNTHDSFVNLIDSTVDIILAARSISRDEKKYADEKGVTLTEKPIAKDALIFMVNPQNPVTSLTTTQIQGIYTGNIVNWNEVGGADAAIKPYVRNANSGSEEKFETTVMAGLTVKSFPEMRVGLTMMSPYYQLKDDINGLGFTPYYYYSTIVDNGTTKAIAVDGVMPNVEISTYVSI